MMHELGHVAGLGHDHPDTNAIMSYAGLYNGGKGRTKIGVDDRNGLTFLYPKSGNEPKAAWGCATLGGMEPGTPSFGEGLGDFLFVWGALLLILVLLKPSRHRKTRADERLCRWCLAGKTTLCSISLMMILLACADIPDENTPEPIKAMTTWLEQSTSRTLFKGNQILFLPHH
jgi:hypothetical protein